MEGINIIATTIGLAVGLAIVCGGIYYLVKEKRDKESRKIYGVVAATGAVITAAVVIKILVAGF